MVIWIYLGALAGVGAIILLVMATGGNRAAVIENLDQARNKLTLDWPDFVQGDGFVSMDQSMALILHQNRLNAALVYAFGNRLTSRMFTPADLVSVQCRSEDSRALLQIELNDVARRRFTLTAPDQGMLESWRSLLSGWLPKAEI